jgi:hypothetical protein
MPQYPLQVDFPNLTQMFVQGQQARLNEQRLQEGQARMALAPKLAAARRAAVQGDPTDLMALAPEEWTAMQEQSRKAAAADLARQKAMTEQWTAKVGLAGRAAETLSLNPNAYPMVARRLAGSGLYKAGELEQLFEDPQQPGVVSPGKVKELAATLPGLLETPEEMDPVQAERQAAAVLEYGTDVEAARGDRRFRPMVERILFEEPLKRAKAGAIVLPSELEAKTKARQQEVLTAGLTELADLNQMRALVTTPEGRADFTQFLGYLPRGKRWTLNTIGKASAKAVPEHMRPWLKRSNTFAALVKSYKAEKFHELLGGAQTAIEIENLVDSVLNMDMSSDQFEAAFNALTIRLNTAMKVAGAVLDSGLVIGSAGYTEAIEKAMRATRGEPEPGADEARLKRLEAGEGTPEDEKWAMGQLGE